MASTLTFAVPVTWSSTTAYTVNTIVFQGKKAFTALKDVPSGIPLTNTEYWSETGVKDIDLSSVTDALNELRSDVDDNTSNISTAQSDIVKNANDITSLTTQLTDAVNRITANADRLDNIMITLYTPAAN